MCPSRQLAHAPLHALPQHDHAPVPPEPLACAPGSVGGPLRAAANGWGHPAHAGAHWPGHVLSAAGAVGVGGACAGAGATVHCIDLTQQPCTAMAAAPAACNGGPHAPPWPCAEGGGPPGQGQQGSGWGGSERGAGACSSGGGPGEAQGTWGIGHEAGAGGGGGGSLMEGWGGGQGAGLLDTGIAPTLSPLQRACCVCAAALVAHGGGPGARGRRAPAATRCRGQRGAPAAAAGAARCARARSTCVLVACACMLKACMCACTRARVRAQCVLRVGRLWAHHRAPKLGAPPRANLHAPVRPGRAARQRGVLGPGSKHGGGHPCLEQPLAGRGRSRVLRARHRLGCRRVHGGSSAGGHTGEGSPRGLAATALTGALQLCVPPDHVVRGRAPLLAECTRCVCSPITPCVRACRGCTGRCPLIARPIARLHVRAAVGARAGRCSAAVAALARRRGGRRAGFGSGAQPVAGGGGGAGAAGRARRCSDGGSSGGGVSCSSARLMQLLPLLLAFMRYF